MRMKGRNSRISKSALLIAALVLLLTCARTAGAASRFNPLLLQRSAIHVLLNDSDPPQRRTAVLHIRPTSYYSRSEAVAALTRALQDQDEGVRVAACMSLREFGPDAASATPNVVKLVGSAGPRLQMEALSVLSAIGPKADDAFEEVEAALGLEPEGVRVYAAAAAIRISGEPLPYLSVLIDALEHGESEALRLNAAQRMGSCGPLAERAIPALIGALDEPGGVGAVAAEAIGKIGRRPYQSVDALLLAAERAERPAIRARALRSLGSFPSEKERTVPVVLDAVRSGDVRLWYALQALSRLDYRAEDLIGKLHSLVRSAEFIDRRGAYEFLSSLAQPPDRFLGPAVQALARDEYASVRRAALRYLQALAANPSGQSGPLVALAIAMGDEDVNIRLEALRAFPSLAEGNQEVLTEILLEAGRDPEYAVMRCAYERLQEFGGDLELAQKERVRELRQAYPGSQYQRWDNRYGLEPLSDVLDSILNGNE